MAEDRMDRGVGSYLAGGTDRPNGLRKT